MPIILEDNATSAQAAAPSRPQYSPKDYCTVLTGNGVNQGLLRSSLTVDGSDNVPQSVISLITTEKSLCTNKPHHVHDDVHSYTTLCQDISVCGGFAQLSHNPGVRAATPLCVMTDHFLTFDDGQGGEITYRSRLFLMRLYVYKAAANYVMASYCLIAANQDDPLDNIVVSYDSLYQAVKSADPVTDLYMLAGSAIKNRNKGLAVKVDDSAALAAADKARSMYDLVMSELEILKTPGTLKSVLQAASAASYEILAYANNILNLVNLPFSLYQSDVIDVVNSRSLDEAKKLKNANMSLSLADTLSSMQGMTAQQIPELVGKKYATNQVVLTTEQIAAVESSSKITVVAAGAGTGKSSCIMHRLTFMEENGCDMKQTFVLSFTRAAAQHIRKNFKDCKSSTIADFTHNFVDVILDNGTGERVDIIAHSDFVQKLQIQIEDLEMAGILPPSTLKALKEFRVNAANIDTCQAKLLDLLDISLNPEANNILSVLKMMHVSSLELDPVIFHTQLGCIKPNVEHIVIDESQDSNRLEFLTMLKMAMMNDISVYIVGKA